MTNVLANLARMTSTTQGTGTLTLVAAVTGCLTFAAAGVTDGQVVTYAIEDYSESGAVSAREIGAGTYTSANLTLTRTTVYASTNAGSKINCSGRQHVGIMPAKEDFDSLLTTTAAASTYLTQADAAATYLTPAAGDVLFLTPAEGNAAYQPLDADLTAIAALVSAANKLPYATGAGTWALSDFSSVARTLVSQTTQALMRTTGLGLGTAATQNTGTTGNVLPFTDGLNTWTAQQIITSTTNISNILAISTETSASAGPFISVRRAIGASDVAANDAIGVFNFQGVDTAGSNTNYGQLACSIVDPTDGSEDGIFRFNTIIAGTLTFRLSVGAGMWAGSPTGGDMGAGTINAVTLYENGTSLASKYGALATANVWTATSTVRIDNAVTNAVTVAETLSHTTSGTPANGIGVSLAFEVETTAANNEVGVTIEAVVTDVTSTSEDFDLVFKTMAAGAAAAERMRIKSTNSILCGTAALATNATDGFLYVPTCAGTPTGAPTAHTGMAPIVVDSTNNKLYFYSGGAWRDAGP